MVVKGSNAGGLEIGLVYAIELTTTMPDVAL